MLKGFVWVLMIYFGLCSCVIVDEQLDTMSNEDFELLCHENYLLAKIGSKKICEENSNFKEKVLELGIAFESIGEENQGQFIYNFLNEWILNFDDEDVQLALQLVITRLQRLGVIKSIQLQDLNVRTVKVIVCVIEGIIDGAKY